MKPKSTDPIAQALQQTAALEAALQEVMHGKGRLHGITDPALIQSQHDRHVFEVVRAGEPAIVKWFTGDDAAQMVEGIRLETAQVRRQFQREYRLAKCLESRPKVGIMVFEMLNGLPLRDMLRRCTAEKRARIMTKAAQWHNAYTGERRAQREFGPWFWITARARAARPGFDADDRRLYGDAIEAMKSLARELSGVMLCKGAVHWDFAPQNFLISDEKLMGFDVGAETHTARARAAAHFLTGSVLCPSGADLGRSGVYAADLDAFCAGDRELAGEDPGILQFFILERLLDRFARRYDHAEDADQLRAALQMAVAS